MAPSSGTKENQVCLPLLIMAPLTKKQNAVSVVFSVAVFVIGQEQKSSIDMSVSIRASERVPAVKTRSLKR